MARLVVIGGGAAGMSAASAARRVDPRLEVVVCEAGGFAAYGMCGIPYYLGGTVAEPENLLAYPPSTFREKRGIDLRLRTPVTGIDPGARQVRLAAGNGAAQAPPASASSTGQHGGFAGLRRAGGDHRRRPGPPAGTRSRRAPRVHDPVPG